MWTFEKYFPILQKKIRSQSKFFFEDRNFDMKTSDKNQAINITMKPVFYTSRLFDSVIKSEN